MAKIPKKLSCICIPAADIEFINSGGVTLMHKTIIKNKIKQTQISQQDQFIKENNSHSKICIQKQNKLLGIAQKEFNKRIKYLGNIKRRIDPFLSSIPESFYEGISKTLRSAQPSTVRFKMERRDIIKIDEKELNGTKK